MKRIKIIALLFVIGAPVVALADTYTLTAGWTDPTPIGPSYTPTYEVERQVGVSAAILVGGLTAPSWSGTLTANPADTINVRARNTNTTGPIVGNWTPWITASAPTGPTQPSDLSGGSLTVIWTGRP